MKKNIQHTLLTLITILFIASCQKDRTVVYVNQNANNGGNTNGNNGKSFFLNTASFLSSYAPQVEKFTKDASNYMGFRSASGNWYALPGNSLLHQDNTPVTGNVEFSLIEYRTKADMIYSGVTTLSGTELLASGAMFYLMARQNGEDLKVKDNTSLELSLNADQNEQRPMDYWVGIKPSNDTNNKIDWKLDNAVQAKPKRDSSSLKFRYELQAVSYKFGYSNLDCIHNPNLPRHKTWEFDPPAGCNDTNSVALIIMNSYKATGYCGWFEDKIIGTKYSLPIGEKYKLLLFRKYGSGENDFEYVLLNEEVKEDNQIVYKGAMTKTTKAGLRDLIDGL